MNSRIYTIAALAVGLFAIVPNTNGQQKQKSDTLSGETVIIIREFEPVIKDARKIDNQPVLKTVEKKAQDFNYDVVPQNNTYTFRPDTIKAAKIKGEPLSKLYRAYAKAGIGNYLNTLGELHINSLRSRDWWWGLDVHHLASNGGIKDLPNNSFSRQNANIYAKKMLKRHIIDGSFTYDREKVYYYGYNQNVLPPNWDYNIIDDYQQYSVFQVETGIQSFITDSNQWNYKIGLNYYHLNENPSGTKEDNFLITSVFTRYYGNEKGFLYLDIDYNNPNYDTQFVYGVRPAYVKSPQYVGNLLIKPGIDVRFSGKQWRLTAGFRMALESEDEVSFYIYPNAEFKYNVVRNLVVPYVGITGGINRTSMNTLRQTNPFLAFDPVLKNERTSYNAYLGVRGVVSSNISYNISGGIKQVRDMALFTSDISVPIVPPVPVYFENVYSPVYDTVNIAFVKAQVSYQKGEKWNVIWRFAFNNYETQNEVKAWNLPNVTSDITVRLNMQNKIVAKAGFLFMGSRYMRTLYPAGSKPLSATVYGRKLDPVFDFNLGVEYRFTPQLSAFIDLNNIFSQNYELWGNYPVQGINVLGGITYSFWKR